MREEKENRTKKKHTEEEKEEPSTGAAAPYCTSILFGRRNTSNAATKQLQRRENIVNKAEAKTRKIEKTKEEETEEEHPLHCNSCHRSLLRTIVVPPLLYHQQHRQKVSPSLFSPAPLFFLLLLLLPISTILQVNSGELLHCSLDQTSPAQPKMTGPGPAQSKKKFKTNIFSKIYDFPVYFSTKFCLILARIFIP